MAQVFPGRQTRFFLLVIMGGAVAYRAIAGRTAEPAATTGLRPQAQV